MSADVARRVSLGAQGFADPRPSGTVDRRHLRRVMGRMKVLQLDSVPVVIRTQYLPLHSRLGPYDTDLLDRIAYHHDEWFEAWAHEASLLPVESEPSFRWAKERARQGWTWKGLHRLAQDEPGYIQAVLDEVRERGAVSGGDLSDPRPIAQRGDGWWNRSLGVSALDWLFRIGEIGIRRTPSFERVFSPLEDIVPAEIRAQPTPAEDEAQRTLTLESVRAVGVGTVQDIADIYRLPIREIRSRLVELVENGDVVDATVAGWDAPAFADPEAKIPRTITGSTVLSPFDPVVWKRDRLERIHGMEYRIEIYVPADKRRWGYYVLPVMIDGHVVARVDVKTHRAERRLEVRAAWAEPDFGPEHLEPTASALDDLTQLVGADAWTVCEQGDLAAQLGDLAGR